MAGANNEYPILDKVVPSWADITAKIQPAGVSLLTTRDIKSISSGSTLEIGVQMAGGRVKGTTTGSQTHEGSMTVYLSGFQTFMKALKDAAVSAGYTRDGGVAQVGLVFFQLDYLYTPPGTTEIWETRLKGCRLLSHSTAPAEGTDASTVDLTFHVTESVFLVDGVEVSLL